MKQKTALIIGVTGQDGLYLTEFLLKKEYRIVGMIQQGIQVNSMVMDYLKQNTMIIYGDLIDIESLKDGIRLAAPDEIYNLAALTHSGDSWHLAIESGEITGLGAHRVFEAMRQIKKECRVFHASSSEIFGRPTILPQNEETPFAPISPYGAAKLYAHTIAQIYRESLNLFIATGILYSHESPRRPLNFLAQKVAYGVACIKLGILNSKDLNERGESIVKDGKIALGNLDAKRDWGFAGDFVKAMWMMLQLEKPDNFIIGTGTAHSVLQLCQTAFEYVGLNWKDHIFVDTGLLRPNDSTTLVADITKAKSILGWIPRTSFSELIKMLVDYHIQNLKKQ